MHFLTYLSVFLYQEGVRFKIQSIGNASDFDLLNASDFAGIPVFGFSPYPSSEKIRFYCTSGCMLTPTESDAKPNILEGDSFYSDGAVPMIEQKFSYADYEAVLSYPSNRTSSYRGCILNVVPLVYVIEDWNNINGSRNPHYVDNGKGGILLQQIATIQTPVIAYAEYDAYVAEPIANTNAEVKGYNRCKAYSSLPQRAVATEDIVIYSNVSWEFWDISKENESWQYTVRNADEIFPGDGHTIRKAAAALYVNDYLKHKVTDSRYGEIYRPDGRYDTRATFIRVRVDLSDGMEPLLIPVANLYQVGLPVIVFTGKSASSCYKGEYLYEGHTYAYKNSISIDFNIYTDAMTRYFCSSPLLFVKASHGMNKSFNISLGSSNFSSNLYSDFEEDILYFDTRTAMSNGVSVYSFNTATIQFETISISTSLSLPAKKNGINLITHSTLRTLEKLLFKKLPERAFASAPLQNNLSICTDIPGQSATAMRVYEQIGRKENIFQ